MNQADSVLRGGGVIRSINYLSLHICSVCTSRLDRGGNDLTLARSPAQVSTRRNLGGETARVQCNTCSSNFCFAQQVSTDQSTHTIPSEGGREGPELGPSALGLCHSKAQEPLPPARPHRLYAQIVDVRRRESSRTRLLTSSILLEHTWDKQWVTLLRQHVC